MPLPRPYCLTIALGTLKPEQRKELAARCSVTASSVTRWASNPFSVRMRESIIIRDYLQEVFDETLSIERFATPIEYGKQ